jgi:hypothetical protein
MRHCIETEKLNKTAEYQWQVGDRWCKLSAQTTGVPTHPEEGSLDQFITEHYWGYSAQRTSGCVEYHTRCAFAHHRDFRAKGELETQAWRPISSTIVETSEQRLPS